LSSPAFLDTGAIYALADKNDIDHGLVRDVYRDHKWRFVTHDLVLIEAFSLITKRHNKQAAIQIVGGLRNSSRIEVVPVTPSLLEAAWGRCGRFADKEWDWIDCTSFELMERHNLTKALSLDHHFAQAGYVLLV
jgi:uncharacterized protein